MCSDEVFLLAMAIDEHSMGINTLVFALHAVGTI